MAPKLHVIVCSTRPGRVGSIEAISLARPRRPEMEDSDAFVARGERLILDMLRHELPDTTLVTISSCTSKMSVRSRS